MYHIVSFVDNDEVLVVPAIWVKNGVCVYGLLTRVKEFKGQPSVWSNPTSLGLHIKLKFCILQVCIKPFSIQYIQLKS